MVERSAFERVTSGLFQRLDLHPVNRFLTNYCGLGYGNTLGGMTITGTFTYDPDNAGPDDYPLNDTCGTTAEYHGSSPDWVNATVTVAGTTAELLELNATVNATWDATLLDPLFDGTGYLRVIDGT